jgi:N-acetylglutamate synthase-like GNAT family acetyltransferase
MTIAYLADYPQYLSTVAGWIFDEWGWEMPKSTLERIQAEFSLHLNRDRIPLTMLALIERQPVGTASIFLHDMDTRMDLSPWLAAVYVLPQFRGQGIGSQLVRTIEGVATRLQLERLYLFTPDREDFYARLDWSVLETAEYRQHSNVIMTKSLMEVA